MNGQRLSARAVRQAVGIGQRWTRQSDSSVVIVFQVHRGEGTVEVHRDGDDPRLPHTRFLVAFGELGSKYRLDAIADAPEAA